MANNSNLRRADKVEFDEYYTQYEYIQKEINAYLEYNPNTFKDKTILLPCDDPEWSNFTKFFAQNFEVLGLKKLISTSYAIDSKKANGQEHIYDFVSKYEKESNQYDERITRSRGKLFILDHDKNKNGEIDIEDLEWSYLEGDGDFRSEEVCKLRDESDIIITNPPFSLLREFITWARDKSFLIIGRETAITYKEIFPLIKNNELWTGATSNSSDMVFGVPEGTEVKPADREKAKRLGYDGNYTRLGNSCWFTNIDHGRRHQNIALMTMDDNLKFTRHNKLKELGYQKYDHIDAINIPFTDSIPIDYNGVMAVPISFLHKFNPDQFEIVNGMNRYMILGEEELNERIREEHSHLCNIDGKATFFRILIRKKD